MSRPARWQLRKRAHDLAIPTAASTPARVDAFVAAIPSVAPAAARVSTDVVAVVRANTNTDTDTDKVDTGKVTDT